MSTEKEELSKKLCKEFNEAFGEKLKRNLFAPLTEEEKKNVEKELLKTAKQAFSQVEVLDAKIKDEKTVTLNIKTKTEILEHKYEIP